MTTYRNTTELVKERLPRRNTEKTKTTNFGESMLPELLYYQKCPVFIKNYEACKETRNYAIHK